MGKIQAHGAEVQVFEDPDADFPRDEAAWQFAKVKAHQTSEVNATLPPPRRSVVLANECVDGAAKEVAHRDAWASAKRLARDIAAEKVNLAVGHIAAFTDTVFQEDGGWSDLGHGVCAELRGKQDPSRLSAKPAATCTQHFHAWRRRGCLWQCTRCLTTAEAPLLAMCPLHPVRRCVLDTLDRFVSAFGHRLWTSLGYTWCAACGAQSKSRLQHLCSVCPGKPRNKSARTFLRRLASGLAPSDRKGAPPRCVSMRFTLQQWLELRGCVLHADGDVFDEVHLLHHLNAMEHSDFIVPDRGEELVAASTASLGGGAAPVAVNDEARAASDSD